MRDKEYDKLIDASDVVCGICYLRKEDVCDTCPVRITIGNYNKGDKL